MNQEQRLIDYLNNHTDINPLQAWQELGIYRLSAVVFKLKSKGHNIITNRIAVKNRFGEKCRVASYRMGL